MKRSILSVVVLSLVSGASACRSSPPAAVPPAEGGVPAPAPASSSAPAAVPGAAARAESPAAAPAPTGPLVGVAPAGFTLDGAVGEWRDPPLFTLGPGDQVAGAQKAQGPSDIGAKVWLAFTGSELILAADVTDDALRFAAAEGDDRQRIRSDHLELWLSFVEPNFPPIGFGNQFGVQEMPQASSCSEVQDPAACQTWWKEQVRHRRSLEEGFARQFVFDGAGLWQVEGGALLRIEGQVAARLERSGGYSIEIQLPRHVLPAVRAATTPGAKVLVDLVDNDQGSEKQETFLSSSRTREVKDRATWAEVRLASPLVVAPADGLVAALLAGGRFTWPGTPKRVYRFDNVLLGYQYQPSEPSPAVLDALIPTQPELVVGDTALWAVKDADSRALYTTVKGVARGEPLAMTCDAAPSPSKFNGQPELLVECETTVSPFGAGACGACPAQSITLVGVGKEGLPEVRLSTFYASPCGSSIERAAAPDLSWIALRTETCEEGGPKYAGQYWKRDPATGMFKEYEGVMPGVKWVALGGE